jgi:hypothetical protein
MGNITSSFDVRLQHRAPGAAAITTTTTLDTIPERVAQRTVYRTIVNVEAIKISANNELYNLVVQLSNDSFTTIEQAAILSMGATEVRVGGSKDSLAGDTYEIMWSTEADGIKYAAARLQLILAGTSPSITINSYSAILGNV